MDTFGPHSRISVAARRLQSLPPRSYPAATPGLALPASSFRGPESWLSPGPRPISWPAPSLPQDTQTFHFLPRGCGGQGLLKSEGGGRRLLRSSSLSYW